MGAPLQNTNAQGNRGGTGRPSLIDEEKIAIFKGLILEYAIEIMETGTDEQKMQLVKVGKIIHPQIPL